MRVLILDDDVEHLNSILSDVEKEFVADVAYNNEDGEYLCSINDYDSLLVSTKCFEKSNHIRNYPNILVLADSACAGYKAKMLNSGADVVMDKTSAASDIAAQLRALMRKKYNHTSVITLSNMPVELDLAKKDLVVCSRHVPLRKKEFQILEYMFINKNKVISEEELLDHVWKAGLDVMSNTLAVHVRNIRRRVEEILGSELISTVRNFGYVVKDY